MRVTILGGTGFIGTSVCKALIERGDSLTILARNPDRVGDQFKASAEIAPWSLAQGPVPGRFLEGRQGVINLAGSPVSRRWTRRVRKSIRSSRIQTTERVVSAMGQLANPPAVLVNASAVGYYGDRGEERLDEAGQPGSGFLAGVCQDWEAAASTARTFGLRVVCPRFGVVLGPGALILERMIPAFRWGLGAVLGSGEQRMPWVHLTDATGLILHALDNPSLDGPVNVVAPESVTNREFARTLAGAVDRRVRFRVPGWILRLALGQMSQVMLFSQHVTPARSLDSGYTFQFPSLKDCIEDVLSPL